MDSVPNVAGINIVLGHNIIRDQKPIVPESVRHSLEICAYTNLNKHFCTLWPILVMRSSCPSSISILNNSKVRAMLVEYVFWLSFSICSIDSMFLEDNSSALEFMILSKYPFVKGWLWHAWCRQIEMGSALGFSDRYILLMVSLQNSSFPSPESLKLYPEWAPWCCQKCGSFNGWKAELHSKGFLLILANS